MQEETIQELADQIRPLVRDHINFILVFGGGSIIDEQWKERHGTDRPKLQDAYGRRTNRQQFTDAVHPAYEIISERIREYLPEFDVLPPEMVRCNLASRSPFDYRGLPNRVINQFASHNIAIGFEGQHWSGRNVNVNADLIAEHITRQAAGRINELILVTGPGGNDPNKCGVIDCHDELVPIMLSGELRTNGTHESPYVSIEGGMRTKVASLLRALPDVGKAVITGRHQLRDEIEKPGGSGTMLVQQEQIECTPIHEDEAEIVRAVLTEHTRAGRLQTPQLHQELMDEAAQNHFVVRIKNSPIGGFSLVDRGKGWKELVALWPDKVSHAYGRLISENWQRAFEESDGHTLYTLAMQAAFDAQPGSVSINIRSTWDNYGMENLGHVSAVQKTRANTLPAALSEYETEKVDPHVLVMRKD